MAIFWSSFRKQVVFYQCRWSTRWIGQNSSAAMCMAVVYYFMEGEEQEEVLETYDDEEKESELDRWRGRRESHSTWAWNMAKTMRRTRHKLEPQCVHKESVKEQQQNRDDEHITKTKDLQCTKTHALTSTASTLTLTSFPSVLNHFTHCSVLPCVPCNWILVAVTIYSILTCMQIPCRVHTAKTGLSRCCLYNHPSVVNKINSWRDAVSLRCSSLWLRKSQHRTSAWHT